MPTRSRQVALSPSPAPIVRLLQLLDFAYDRQAWHVPTLRERLAAGRR